MDSLLPKSKVCIVGQGKIPGCGEEKLLEEFGRAKKGKYGRKSKCKACMAEYQKQYYKDNKEKIAKYNKQHHKDNKEYRNNKSKKWLQNNKEKRNETKRDRHKNDEQYRIRHNLSRRLWIVLNKIGKTKTASILTYIGCTIEFMKEHLNSTKKPEWGDDLHIDHIIPSSLFDHTNEEEIKKCWNWRNLRYIPAEENISKGDTLDMGLVKSYGIEDLLPQKKEIEHE